MFLLLLITDKVPNEKEEDQGGKNIERHIQLEILIIKLNVKKICVLYLEEAKEEDQDFMSYKKT